LSELLIIEKASDCFKYLHNALNYFPKSEKFVLAADIRVTFFEMLSLFLTANKSLNKKKILYDADIKLDLLRFKIRAAKELQLLKLKQYEVLSKQLSEIGKMLGGWIKSAK
jgi:hypothetical protein